LALASSSDSAGPTHGANLIARHTKSLSFGGTPMPIPSLILQGQVVRLYVITLENKKQTLTSGNKVDILFLSLIGEKRSVTDYG
jgi:hypothetical protein